MIKKKILKIVLIMITFILLMQVHSMAAVIVSTDKQVETGSGTVTISVTSKQSLGAYTLELTDTAGLTLVSASAGENTEISTDNKKMEGSYPKGTTSLGSFTFKVPDVTKDTKYTIKFKVTGMETPNLDKIQEETNTAVLTVKAKETVPETPPTTTTPETPTTPSTPATTTPTTPEEPTFTSVNETVYAKQTVNIRESYTTSSKILGSLQKGKEVTRTGVGSNGWSKVTYNGKTAYISSEYLTTTKPVEEEKSNNANLKSLVIENQELIPSFSANTVAYTLQVPNEITELNITAEAEDKKATVSIKGNQDLKEGENLVTISVSAEDGTAKIYEIKVTRLETMPLGLTTLKIEDTNIANKFKTDLYEYEITIKEKTELDIEAVANDENATVEVIGNEDLKEGENIITIIVTSQDGEQKVTYQIKVNKLAYNVAGTTEDNNKLDSKIYIYIAIGVILCIALGIVIFYTIKHRNQEEYEYEDEEFEGFPEELPERQEDLENTQPFSAEEEKRKSKIDYFLDVENEEGNKKGKHF